MGWGVGGDVTGALGVGIAWVITRGAGDRGGAAWTMAWAGGSGGKNGAGILAAGVVVAAACTGWCSADGGSFAAACMIAGAGEVPAAVAGGIMTGLPRLTIPPCVPAMRKLALSISGDGCAPLGMAASVRRVTCRLTGIALSRPPHVP